MTRKVLKILIVITGAAAVVLFILFFQSIVTEENKLLSSSRKSLAIREDFGKNTIPDFTFVNQFGKSITRKTFDNKIYIADFFFTTCPTICPMMTGNKLKVQEAFENNDDVLILSHSIDTQTDSIRTLYEYGKEAGVLEGKWHLVTGEHDAIYDIAKEYYVTAQKNDVKDGSFIHDGSFILIGKDGTIRGIYDGTDYASTQTLINDIHHLLRL